MFFTEAQSCNPDTEIGAWKVKDKASNTASTLAKNHYPYAILGSDEASKTADEQCQKWWRYVEGSANAKDIYPSVHRLYVGTFVNVYMNQVDELRKADEESKAAKARREAENRERERRRVELEEQPSFPARFS